MPAKSKRQQQAAAAELERRRSGEPASRFKSMSTEDLKDFAATDTKGLPERSRKSR